MFKGSGGTRCDWGREPGTRANDVGTRQAVDDQVHAEIAYDSPRQRARAPGFHELFYGRYCRQVQPGNAKRTLGLRRVRRPSSCVTPHWQQVLSPTCQLTNRCIHASYLIQHLSLTRASPVSPASARQASPNFSILGELICPTRQPGLRHLPVRGRAHRGAHIPRQRLSRANIVPSPCWREASLHPLDPHLSSLVVPLKHLQLMADGVANSLSPTGQLARKSNTMVKTRMSPGPRPAETRPRFPVQRCQASEVLPPTLATTGLRGRLSPDKPAHPRPPRRAEKGTSTQLVWARIFKIITWLLWRCNSTLDL